MKRYFLWIFACVLLGGLIFVSSTYPDKREQIPHDRLIYSSTGITFHYPKTFGANVWKAVTWPPKVTVVNKNQEAMDLGCPTLKDAAIISES
jgi:hypothetical protein